jgi:pimeloyl-ACP methyl ester carboxylesterase
MIDQTLDVKGVMAVSDGRHDSPALGSEPLPARSGSAIRPDQLEHLHRSARVAGIDIADGAGPLMRDTVVNRVRLTVLDWGPPSAPTVVLLHGGSLTAHTWDLVCAALSQQYRCLAVDLRGHGDSEWPADGDYRLAALEADISTLIAAECLTPPVLVGMSLGGLTAIATASSGKVPLAGLVIVDVGPDMRFEGARNIVAFTASDQIMPGIDDFVAKAMAFNPRRKPELLRRSLLNNLRPLPNGHWTWKWDPRRMHQVDLQAMAREHAELWSVIPRISCPALVVRGSLSTVFLAEDASRLAQALPRARSVVIEDAGHTVQGDNPREFLAQLKPFLNEVLPA